MDSQPLPPPKILIFDSGVGGLSILEAVAKCHPHCQLIYASDNAAFPYGTKKEKHLIDRVNHVLTQLQDLVAADIIILACNSASTVALPVIRQRFSEPIIGVVPAIKPAVQLSKTKVIGLLATVGTVKRTYTRQLIKDYASDCEVITLGSNELVMLAERKLRGQAVHLEELRLLLAPFMARDDMDTVVLACTHFPLLKAELQAVMPEIDWWVDSGAAIASRVVYWLERLKLPQQAVTGLPHPNHHCLFTAKNQDIESLKPYLLERRLGEPQFVNIDQIADIPELVKSK